MKCDACNGDGFIKQPHHEQATCRVCRGLKVLPTVVGVAIMLIDTGEVHALPKPANHDRLRRTMEAAGVDLLRREEGFLLSTGDFVRRMPALHIARRAKQIIKRELAPLRGLHSCDVWPSE